MRRDTRLWMYRKGEARLFAHPGEVPEGEDWQRFPAVREAAAKAPTAPAPEQEPALSQEEKLDRMSRPRLMQVAADCGVRFDISWTKAQLKQAIVGAIDDNGA